MYYKRNESYRFVFNQPVTGKLTKREESNTVNAVVEVLDVSNEGAKVRCNHDINFARNQKVYLSFSLNSSAFHAPGTVIWSKRFHSSTEMGLHLQTDNEYRNNMIKELKEIAKQKKKSNK
ncbi:PilZ domain-containing protein [Virgibacillus kekensis]|uniref:PilZ domain-containing protein n=1 Tax=Virgibacillus kekensis TaxID=202261 RepID=A0ABV9DDR7_9BACI